MRPDQVLDFALLYGANCAGCHGADGRGGAALGLANPIYLAIVDDDTLRAVTAHGVQNTAMPAFAKSAGGTLTDEQIGILVNGMRSRWGKADALGGAKAPPYAATGDGNSQHGSHLFNTYCAGCHGPDGNGGAKAGSVVDGSFLALVSNQSLRTLLIAGRPDIDHPDWRGYAAGRPLTASEVSDIVAWLATQRRQFPGQPYPSSS